jgi:hypothetical protein
MFDPASISFWVFLWVAAAALIFIFRWRHRDTSVGLVFAFLCNFAILHWVGAATYLRSWFGGSDPDATRLGLVESTYAVLALAIGSLVLAPRVLRRFRIGQSTAMSHETHRDFPAAFLVVGLATYLVFSGDLGRLPSMSAVRSVSQQFIVVGICLLCRDAWQRRDIASVLAYLGAGMVLPFFTIVSSGFLGFGAMACFTILCFLSGMIRSLWRFTAATLGMAMLFLSLYVSYMRDRKEIRQVVWGGQSTQQRIGRVYSMVATLEWFDPFNDDHLRRIDGRLNQDYLVGRAVEYLSMSDSYANGETLADAAIALVPRVIWPDKPVSAGSGDLVSRFTGMHFGEGTSVGIGQVMEWYANFGRAGIVIWFLFVGVLLTVADTVAGIKLRSGDWLSFTIWYVPSLALLNIGGSLVEVSGTAGASIVVVALMNKVFLYRLQRRQKSIPLTESEAMPVGLASGRRSAGLTRRIARSES